MRIFIPENIIEKEALARTTDLCICAHQDDAEIMAFHAIYSCFKNPDKHYTGITMCDGAGSPRIGKYSHFTNEMMKAERVREQEQAAILGEYSAQVQLGYPSSVIKDMSCNEVEDELCDLILKTLPQRIYIHNPLDKHTTHIAACIRVINALRSISDKYRAERVYGMEVWRSLDWLMDSDKVVFNSTEALPLAKEVLSVFDSQIEGGKNYADATIGRWMANATFLESHLTDIDKAAAYGVDLTDAIYSNVSIQEYVEGLINKTLYSINENIIRYSK